MHRLEPDGSIRRQRDRAQVVGCLQEQQGPGPCLWHSLALLCPSQTSSKSVFHSSFGIGLQNSPGTDSSKLKELSKLFIHAFIVKGSKSQRMKQHEVHVSNMMSRAERKEMGKS